MRKRRGLLLGSVSDRAVGGRGLCEIAPRYPSAEPILHEAVAHQVLVAKRTRHRAAHTGTRLAPHRCGQPGSPVPSPW